MADYTDEEKKAYFQLLHSLSTLDYLAIKYYRLGSNEEVYPGVAPVGGGPEDQTKRAKELCGILRDAHKRIAELVKKSIPSPVAATVGKGEPAALAAGPCPSGFRDCGDGICVHKGLPCP